MKIDVCLMNPPYNRDLHLKFLEKVIGVAEKVISVQPVRWLQDPLAKYKKSTDFKKYENSIVKNIADLEIFNEIESRKMFNVGFNSKVGILTLDKNGGFNFNNDENLIQKLIKKILKVKRFSYKEDNFTKEYKIIIPAVHGHNENKDWTELTSKTYKVALNVKDSSKTNKYLKLSFDTENERLNFYNSLFTTFYKYLIVELRTSSVIAQFIEYLPWMEDYSKPWTDKRFCDYFGITGYISDTEAEPNSEWEEILKDLKKHR